MSRTGDWRRSGLGEQLLGAGIMDMGFVAMLSGDVKILIYH